MSAVETINRTRRAVRRGGFSLIELIAVIVILAILSATAVPTLSAITVNRQRQAARQLLRDMTLARQWAVATGTRTWVIFDTGAETWTVKAEDPEEGNFAGAARLKPARNQVDVEGIQVVVRAALTAGRLRD